MDNSVVLRINVSNAEHSNTSSPSTSLQSSPHSTKSASTRRRPTVKRNGSPTSTRSLSSIDRRTGASSRRASSYSSRSTNRQDRQKRRQDMRQKRTSVTSRSFSSSGVRRQSAWQALKAKRGLDKKLEKHNQSQRGSPASSESRKSARPKIRSWAGLRSKYKHLSTSPSPHRVDDPSNSVTNTANALSNSDKGDRGAEPQPLSAAAVSAPQINQSVATDHQVEVAARECALPEHEAATKAEHHAAVATQETVLADHQEQVSKQALPPQMDQLVASQPAQVVAAASTRSKCTNFSNSLQDQDDASDSDDDSDDPGNQIPGAVSAVRIDDVAGDESQAAGIGLTDGDDQTFCMEEHCGVCVIS